MSAMGGTRITIVFDNDAVRPGLRYGWGFAAVVERGGARVLFDTGPDPAALKHNLAALGFDPATFDCAVISHDHWDHTGGLAGILRARPGLVVLIPACEAGDLGRRIERMGGKPVGCGPALETGSDLAEVVPGVLSTGEMAATPPEHSLVLPGPDGPGVLTGCCHQGIVRLAGLVSERFRKPVQLAAGGFHLFRTGRDELPGIALRLRELGVVRLVPTHCTGRAGVATLAREWGDDCLRGGAGRVIDLP
jgi:7,8-dihydropterin-6-yl-methyl-4-(beta-D-ribofuranosyl)aminobenzene 5'-phosphate synthase